MPHRVPPFPVLLRLLSDPLLALFVLQGDKVPVVVDQKILWEKKIEIKMIK